MTDIKITLTRSLIGYEKSQAQTARALGLGKIGSSVTQPDNPAIRGMIHKLAHVLVAQTVDGAVISQPAPRDGRKYPHGRQHGPLGKKRN